MSNQETKKRGRKKKKVIDYTDEYKEHKRCPNCNLPTQGIEDYKNIKSGKITKTCKRCRHRVLKSYNLKCKKLTKKDYLNAYRDILKLIHNDVITQATKDKEEFKPFLKEVMV